MRLLIIGHSGFIGAALCARARHAGVAFDVASLPECDLTRADHIAALSNRFGPDVSVVVLAGIKRQLGDTAEIFHQNLRMITGLCGAFHSRPAGRVVYVSSAAVYGEEVHNLAITEETGVQPQSLYGIAKLASEQLLARERRAGRIASLLSVRPPLVYGAGDPSLSYGPSGFARMLHEGRPITLWGDGSELRSFLLVDDLAEALLQLAVHPVEGVLNVAPSPSQNFSDVLRALAEISGVQPEIAQRPRSKEKVDNVFDNSRFRSALPDFQFTPLREGLARVWRGVTETRAG